MAEESLCAQIEPRKPLIFLEIVDQIAIKCADGGHISQPYIFDITCQSQNMAHTIDVSALL